MKETGQEALAAKQQGHSGGLLTDINSMLCGMA